MSQRFLANYSCRPVLVPASDPFALRGVVITPRTQSVDLIIADSAAAPLDSVMRSSWRTYAANRHVPVLFAVAHADQVALCGPDSDSLPSTRILPRAEAEALCTAAVESGDWSRLLSMLGGVSIAPLIVTEKAVDIRPVITAEQIKVSDRHWMHRRAFLEWTEFLLGETHVLRRHPELLPQQAANQRAASAPARAAVQWRDGQGKRRPWFRVLNAPKERSACVSVLSGHADAVTALAFLPACDQLVTASLDGMVRVWDLVSGRVRLELETASRSMNTCAISPNGEWITTGGADGYLEVWTSRTGARHTVPSRSGAAITSCTFAPDGSRLAVGFTDGVLALIDTATWKAIAETRGSGGSLSCCAYTPRGRWIIAIAGDTLLRWSAHQPGDAVMLRSHDQPIAMCAVSPDERWIISAAGNELKLTSPDGQHKRSMKVDKAVSADAFSPDGRWFALAQGSDIEVRGTRDDGKLRFALRGHSAEVTACRFSQDGRLLASCARDNTVRLWLVERIPASDAPLERRTATIRAISLDGRRIASVSGSELTVMERGKEITSNKVSGPGGPVLACEFSASGWILVAATEGKTLQVWRSLTPGPTLKGHKGRVSSCAFSPDGRFVASGASDNTARVWNASNWSHIAILEGHEGPVNSVLFEPAKDEPHVLTASDDGTVRRWTASGKRLTCWSGHTGPVSACAFSPDYRSVVSASGDGTVRIWRARDGRSVAVLEGHSAPVRGCAYSADGRWILSTADNGEIRVWDAGKFTLHATLADQGASCAAAAFSPDGVHIASANDECVLVWDIDRRSEVARFFTDGSTSSLRWSPSGCLAVGTDGGVMHILSVENLGPLRVTPWTRQSGWLDRKPKAVHFGCPVCRKWSSVESPQVEREIQCPTCAAPIRVNPFMIEGDWEPVQAAWTE